MNIHSVCVVECRGCLTRDADEAHTLQLVDLPLRFLWSWVPPPSIANFVPCWSSVKETGSALLECPSVWILLIVSPWCCLVCVSVLCSSCKFVSGSRGLIMFKFSLFWPHCFGGGGVCVFLWSVSGMFQVVDTQSPEQFIQWGLLNGDLLIL